MALAVLFTHLRLTRSVSWQGSHGCADRLIWLLRDTDAVNYRFEVKPCKILVQCDADLLVISVKKENIQV